MGVEGDSQSVASHDDFLDDKGPEYAGDDMSKLVGNVDEEDQSQHQQSCAAEDHTCGGGDAANVDVPEGGGGTQGSVARANVNPASLIAATLNSPAKCLAPSLRKTGGKGVPTEPVQLALHDALPAHLDPQRFPSLSPFWTAQDFRCCSSFATHGMTLEELKLSLRYGLCKLAFHSAAMSFIRSGCGDLMSAFAPHLDSSFSVQKWNHAFGSLDHVVATIFTTDRKVLKINFPAPLDSSKPGTGNQAIRRKQGDEATPNNILAIFERSLGSDYGIDEFQRPSTTPALAGNSGPVTTTANEPDDGPFSNFPSMFWPDSGVDAAAVDRATHRLKLRVLFQLMCYAYYVHSDAPCNAHLPRVLKGDFDVVGIFAYRGWLCMLHHLACHLRTLDVSQILDQAPAKLLHQL